MSENTLTLDIESTQEDQIKMAPVHTIYHNMLHAQRLLAAEGIAKSSRNNSQNYNFRGIDDLLAVLPKVLNQADLLIQPNVVDVDIRERGKTMHVIMKVDYIMTNSQGQECIRRVYGEALDYSDKAVNKAMTAAYKYFLFQAFCIPLQGMPDADSEHIEIDSENISDHQIQDMRDLLDALGKTEKHYCAHFGIESLADIPKKQFKSAKGALEKKLKENNEENEAWAK